MSSHDQPLVFLTRRLHELALERLSEHATVVSWNKESPPTKEELRLNAAIASGLITAPTDRVDAALLDACPRLKVVANVAVGFDNFDLDALRARRIPASNTPGVLTDATADLTFGLMIGAARRFTEARQVMLNGGWKTWQPDFLLGLDLSGATLGVVGTGRIGEAVIRRARAFSMKVLAWSRTPRPIDGVRYVSLDELCTSSDVVTLHLALTSETHGIIGARELGLMKDTALLVNAARGGLVDEEALIEALSSRQIAGAGLDVFANEPIPQNHPLLQLANCLVLPHIGSATRATRLAMANLAVDNVCAGLAGERLLNCVNPEVYEFETE